MEKRFTMSVDVDELKKKFNTTFEDSFSEEVWRTTYKHHTDYNVNDTLFRVAQAIASVEDTQLLRDEWTEKFYEMLSNFKVVPGGRILSNAGTGWGGTTLINCFVNPRSSNDLDSLDGILTNLRNQAQTLKSEGGWGENFSYIRPRGSFIAGIGVETPGAVKYMELFDKSSEIITSGSGKKSSNSKSKQKIRKGAMMGVLDVWHPDVYEFITAKQQPGRLTKFNISVNCTDDFMNKVKLVKQLRDNRAPVEEIDAADSWILEFPDTTHPSYSSEWDGNLRSWKNKGHPTVTYETTTVTALWDKIMESTYNRAEPGVLFLDRANFFNPLSYAEHIASTNPCGEQVLSPGNICCLSSLNLTQFFDEKSREFDFDAMKKYASYAVRFLDNVNSYSKAPLQEYMDSMDKKRRIGVGLMGWGSLLYMMKIPFASQEAFDFKEKLLREFSHSTYQTSIDLAVEKGMFELCEPIKHAEQPFVKKLELPEEYIEKLRTTGIRNSALMSNQPTGNSSIFANVVSGGIEPVFMPEYVRTVIVNAMPDEIKNVCPKWYEGEWYETEMFKLTKEGDEDILKGTFNGVTYKIDRNRGLTKEVVCQDYGVRWLHQRGEWDPTALWAKTTMNLSAQDHVNDLKGFAEFADSAVSKTCNIPHDYPYESFKDLYLQAYDTGYIKGFTTYRAGTMTAVLSAKDEKTAADDQEEIVQDDVRIPSKSPATMNIIKAEGKKYYLTSIMDDENKRPIALFVNTNHHEKTATTHDAVERLLNLAREKSIPEKWINETEQKIANDTNINKLARTISLLLRHGVFIKNVVRVLDQVEDVYVGSFLFQIKKYLSQYIRDGEQADGVMCNACGSSNVVFSEGCFKCVDCGSSKCG